MGVQGLATQGGVGDLHSDFHGSVGKIVVTGNIQNADISALGTTSTGNRMGKIGHLEIGGSLVGGGSEDSGRIFTGGSIARVRIGGSVIGGSGDLSGSMFAEGGYGDIRIGGDLQGAGGGGSGGIACNTGIAALSIGGSIVGGDSGPYGSGYVMTYAGKIHRLVVGGSLVGGTGFYSGRIQAYYDLVSLSIQGNLSGGLGQGSGQVISRFGSIRKVLVGGDIVSGIGFETGAITAGDNLGNVVVKGNILGTATNRVVIEAEGADGPARIGNITVDGSVTFTDILSGYNNGFFRDRTRADATIGRVTVGVDWVASNLVAGVDVGADGLFGTADDGTTVAGSPKFISRIGAITINGTAVGTPAGADQFGIVAERVVALSIGGTKIALQYGPVNDLNVTLGTTGDFVLKELSA